MKSNQVIFGNLSNSGKHVISLVEIVLWLTKYSGLPKEDVHNGDVLVVGAVVHLVLMSLIGSEMYLTKTPWWAMIWAPCHPWSLGTSPWVALLSCWCRWWWGCHRSPGRLVATLPERLRSSCRRGLGSSSESHKFWAWICWFDQKKIRDILRFDLLNFVLDLNSADVAFGKYAMWSQSVEQYNKIVTSSRNDASVT